MYHFLLLKWNKVNLDFLEKKATFPPVFFQSFDVQVESGILGRSFLSLVLHLAEFVDGFDHVVDQRVLREAQTSEVTDVDTIDNLAVLPCASASLTVVLTSKLVDG